MVLGNRISLINSKTEVETLTASINGLIGPNLKYDPHITINYGDSSTVSGIIDPPRAKWTGALEAHSDNLSRRLHKIEQGKLDLARSLKCKRQKIAELKERNYTITERLSRVRRAAKQAYETQTRLVDSIITSKSSEMKTISDAIDNIAWSQCRDLASLFAIKKRKKRQDVIKETAKNGGVLNGFETDEFKPPSSLPTSEVSGSGGGNNCNGNAHYYDILVGFVAVPDLSSLSHYQHATINSSLERLAYFCSLVGYYLDVRLTYDILLPQKSQPILRMFHAGINIRQSMYLNESVKSIAEQKPKLFEKYACGLAMLALDLALVARTLGVNISTCEEISQLNKVVASIYRSLVPSEKKKEETTGSTVEKKYYIDRDYPLVDLSTLQEFIVAQTYLDINGGSAEWNLIDIDETTEPSG